MFNETFVKCPKCEHPYFEEKKKFTINKSSYEMGISLKKETIVTFFICEKCKFVLKKETKEELI